VLLMGELMLMGLEDRLLVLLLNDESRDRLVVVEEVVEVPNGVV
jgi:hypothetical protein